MAHTVPLPFLYTTARQEVPHGFGSRTHVLQQLCASHHALSISLQQSTYAHRDLIQMVYRTFCFHASGPATVVQRPPGQFFPPGKWHPPGRWDKSLSEISSISDGNSFSHDESVTHDIVSEADSDQKTLPTAGFPSNVQANDASVVLLEDPYIKDVSNTLCTTDKSFTTANRVIDTSADAASYKTAVLTSFSTVPCIDTSTVLTTSTFATIDILDKQLLQSSFHDWLCTDSWLPAELMLLDDGNVSACLPVASFCFDSLRCSLCASPCEGECSNQKHATLCNSCRNNAPRPTRCSTCFVLFSSVDVNDTDLCDDCLTRHHFNTAVPSTSDDEYCSQAADDLANLPYWYDQFATHCRSCMNVDAVKCAYCDHCWCILCVPNIKQFLCSKCKEERCPSCLKDDESNVCLRCCYSDEL
jgi:hypothetical protein